MLGIKEFYETEEKIPELEDRKNMICGKVADFLYDHWDESVEEKRKLSSDEGCIIEVTINL